MAERHSSRCCCAHLRSPYGQRRELQDRVPVPTRSARAKLLVDDGVGQARAADTVRVHDVEMFARSGDHFAALDGLLQRLNARSAGRMLEQHHDQMARRSPGRAKDEIPALQQRPDVREAQLREEIAQIGHRDLLVAADIDAPEEGEVDGHALRINLDYNYWAAPRSASTSGLTWSSSATWLRSWRTTRENSVSSRSNRKRHSNRAQEVCEASDAYTSGARARIRGSRFHGTD